MAKTPINGTNTHQMVKAIVKYMATREAALPNDSGRISGSNQDSPAKEEEEEEELVMVNRRQEKIREDKRSVD